MSDNVNTELLEKIAERIDGYSGEYSDFEYHSPCVDSSDF